jgi:UPF0271 protein
LASVDLNSDLGEGFGPYQIADDVSILSIVTSASVACGFHAGDPEIMHRTFLSAKERGVVVGAHPGFPDIVGFGRRRIPYSTGEIERMVAYQVGAAQAVAAYSGHAIRYVKPHGALANLAETERDVADAIASSIKAIDASLAFLGIALSQQVVSAESVGLKTISEVFADRGYDNCGRLLRRGTFGALIESPEEAAQHALSMIEEGAIIASDGKRLPTPIGSICVHSDTARSVAIARAVRAGLEGVGIRVAAFAAP